MEKKRNFVTATKRASEQHTATYLVDACADKQAAVGTALDGQARWLRVLFLAEELGGRLEIIKAVLLGGERARLVPHLAVFSGGGRGISSEGL